MFQCSPHVSVNIYEDLLILGIWSELEDLQSSDLKYNFRYANHFQVFFFFLGLFTTEQN